VKSLIGSAPQDLSTAVEAGAITRTQAVQALREQRHQIVSLLTSSRPLLKVAAPAK
jgi:predicted RNA-binding protein associated with RNAse of E/G family